MTAAAAAAAAATPTAAAAAAAIIRTITRISPRNANITGILFPSQTCGLV